MKLSWDGGSVKVDVGEKGELVLSELFNGVTIQCPVGSIHICHRDDTIEICTLNRGETKNILYMLFPEGELVRMGSPMKARSL